MKPLTIGQLARSAGVGVETIRFYERKGLVEEPPRRASGYRQYDLEAVRRIRFIRHAKELGFTLREIKELLDLRVGPDCRCGEVLKLAQVRMADIEQRISDLRKMSRALSALTRDCQQGRPSAACPILDALDREEGEVR